MKGEKIMGLLDDIKVLEVAEGIAGPYCGKLLADLGAEVIKLELPGIGDRARAMAPFVNDKPHQEGSLLFSYLNTNKMSVTLDWRKRSAEQSIHALLKESDVLVTDEIALRYEGSILNVETFKKLNPELVMVVITSFGLDSPYVDYKAYDLVAVNMGGIADALPGYIEDPAKEPPLRPAGQQSEYLAGLHGATAASEGLFARNHIGGSFLADVSKQEAIASVLIHRTSAFAAQKEKVSPSRTSSSTRGQFQRMAGHLPCADGFICITMGQAEKWQSLLQVIASMDNPSWVKDERFQTILSSLEHWDILYPLLTEGWTKLHSKEEIVTAGQAKGVPVGPVNTPADIAESPQLKARDFFAVANHPLAGIMTMPTGAFHYSIGQMLPCRPAPLLGEHTEMVIKEMSGYTEAKRRERTVKRPVELSDAPKPRQALEGIRIADFSWVWAGPACTKYLATMGAEVIKIETRTRPEAGRNGPGFTMLNYNKRSCTINLKTAQGIRLAKELVAASDVVTENFLPGTMERLGLGYEALREVNPDIIMLSSSAMGRGGPISHYSAYGDIIFSYAGHAYLTNYPEGPPRSVAGYWGDLLTGMTSAFGVLAALHYRERTGQGLYIDLSMVESTLSLLPEPMLDFFANGRVARPRGNRDEVGAPHGCYRCLGDDKWIAIAVFTDKEWCALCKVMGREELTEDQRFSSLASRREHLEELDSIITDWTRLHSAEELFHTLQKAGVSAGPSYNIEELIHDKSLTQRGLFVEIQSAEMGNHLATALPWKLEGLDPKAYRPAPVLGKDNDYVFQKLLGLTIEEQRSLEEQKVIY